MGSLADNDITPIWSEAFETGDPEIDRQHQCLLVDSVRLKALVERGAPRDEVIAALTALIADCSAHFRFEEAMLRNTNFPRAEVHAGQHQAIEAMLQQLANMIADPSGTAPESDQLTITMEQKIIEIIVRHDLDFKSHLLAVHGR
ncbi:MAG: hemerythrin family protein [Proteobacteria bacterium]|nr:hemerythrin family protein [Pseudomonadota bacterium]